VIAGHELALAATAVAVGFFIGAVGVGGILLIPALVWFGGIPIHQATATALFSFSLPGFVGTWLFHQRGSIDWRITRPVLAGAIVFSYLGARVNAMVNARTLTLVIALAVIFAGAYILLPSRYGREGYCDGRSRRHQLSLLLVGALAGFGSGLSGAGGPLFAVPMMLVLGFVPLVAIGASQVLQIVASVFGTMGNLRYGSIHFRLAGEVMLLEVAGMFVGFRVAHLASVTLLRRTAAVLCVMTGLVMLARLS
jgi:uncharacterized membrane protein YfcA